jgi:hypothetical protein
MEAHRHVEVIGVLANGMKLTGNVELGGGIEDRWVR